MSNLPSLHYSPVDYETIEAAVVETERGRWFLAEYQRRNRHADTAQVLTAIEKMQSSLAATVSEHIASSIAEHPPVAKQADPAIEVLRQDLVEMALRIADTHTEVAALGSQDHDPKHIDLVSGELDAIVRSTEQATSEILESAEQIQEIAWTLREGGLAVETCDAIDARATNIYLACSFQDLTAQRATKVIETMRFLENRINKMIGILQGVEGFRISDLTPEAVETVSAGGIDEADRTLEQNDVDFALQWESEQDSEADGPDAFASFAQDGPKAELFGLPDDLDPMFSDEGVLSQPLNADAMSEREAYLSEAEIAQTLDTLPPELMDAPRTGDLAASSHHGVTPATVLHIADGRPVSARLSEAPSDAEPSGQMSSEELSSEHSASEHVSSGNVLSAETLPEETPLAEPHLRKIPLAEPPFSEPHMPDAQLLHAYQLEPAPAAKRLSKLEALDEAELNKKLSLFT